MSDESIVSQSGQHIPIDKILSEKKKLYLASAFDNLVEANMKLIIAVNRLIIVSLILETTIIVTFVYNVINK